MAASIESQLHPNGTDKIPPTYATLLEQSGFTEIDGDLISLTEAGLPRRIDPFPLAEKQAFQDDSSLHDADLSRILFGLRHLDEPRQAGRHRVSNEDEQQTPAEPAEPEAAAPTSPFSWFEPVRQPVDAPVIPGRAVGAAAVIPSSRMSYEQPLGIATPPASANLQTATTVTMQPAVDTAPQSAPQEPTREHVQRLQNPPSIPHSEPLPPPSGIVGRRGRWQETGDPEQEQRLNAFLSSEDQPQRSSALVRLARRIGATLSMAAQPVMEEVATPPQTEEELPPPRRYLHRPQRRLPDTATFPSVATITPTPAPEVAPQAPQAPQPPQSPMPQPPRPEGGTRSNPVFVPDPEDSEIVARMRAFYQENRETNEPNRYLGNRRVGGERKAFFAFMARGLGCVALGGEIALCGVWAATNSEKVSSAIDAARRLVESVLSN